MRLDQRRLIDQVLVAEEPCLGALFASYTFDPAHFEDHVLRSVLRLRNDPEEDAARYHEEARVALQETPVAVFVDASVRRPGRRLPYDLHLIRSRTFHPKVYLLLFESEARLAVGSGNLTKSGLEQNTEMFFVRTLHYDVQADAAVLRGVDDFFEGCAGLTGTPTTQLDLVRRSLRDRISATAPLRDSDRVDIQLVTSFGGPLLERLGAALPAEATVTRVGVLAPFFEQDDLDVAKPDEGLRAVLGEVLSLRRSEGATFDLAVPWDDAPLAPTASEAAATIDEHLGALWAWRRKAEARGEGQDDGGERAERVEYLSLETASTKRIEATNAAGETCRLDRGELQTAIAEGRLWPVSRPTVFAPRTILQHLANERPVALWLHPSAELSPSGRARRRPLHAKVVLVTVKHRGKHSTYALIGSANASRSALTRAVAQGGNVEAVVLCRFDGEVTLHELLPSLVRYAIDRVELVERDAPVASLDMSAWIADVAHDAAAHTLCVTWHADGPAPLGAWTLRYADRVIARGEGPPSIPTEVTGFDLDAASTEITLTTPEGAWQVPIRIVDLAALPTSPLLAALGLRELLALLGRRVGAERLTTLHHERGPAGVASVLEAVFGEGFGPTDVFKAWWGAAEDLASARTVAAFRHRLVGTTGVLAVWRHFRQVPAEELSPDEIWVYGCELLRELSKLAIDDGPDARTKRGLLAEAMTTLRSDLDSLSMGGGIEGGAGPDWLAEIARFYRVGGTHARA